MPHPNYVKGRKKEYKICHQLRREGYDIVQRTAGSHSPIDIIAISKKDKEIVLIQSKTEESFTEAEKKKLLKEFEWMKNKLFMVDFWVV